MAPHLTADNADELVAAATHRRKAEIEAWLAGRFLPAVCVGVASPALPARVIAVGPPARPHELAPGQVAATPPARFVVQLPIGEAPHAKLREAQRLLSHAVPSGDLAEVFDRALDALLATLVKRKFAATAQLRPRSKSARSGRPRAVARARTVPAHVRRAVWGRDRGQCTFTSVTGRRCTSHRLLEFDHVIAFARGGEATVEGLRLHCRAHNQLEAERTFGAGFMRRKREESRRRRAIAPRETDPEVEALSADSAVGPTKPVAAPRMAHPWGPRESKTACARRSGSWASSRGWRADSRSAILETPCCVRRP